MRIPIKKQECWEFMPVSQSASMNEDQFVESVEFVKACAKGAEVQEGLFVDADDTNAVADYVEGSILKY